MTSKTTETEAIVPPPSVRACVSMGCEKKGLSVIHVFSRFICLVRGAMIDASLHPSVVHAFYLNQVLV